MLLLRGEDPLGLLRRDRELLLHAQDAVLLSYKRGILLLDFGFMRLQAERAAHHPHSRGLHNGLLHLLEKLTSPAAARQLRSRARPAAGTGPSSPGGVCWGFIPTNCALLPGHGHDVRLAGRGHDVRLAGRGHRHRHRHRHLVLHAIPRLVSLQVLRREKHAELLRRTQHGVRRGRRGYASSCCIRRATKSSSLLDVRVLSGLGGTKYPR